jgi:hypothetical protein
MNQIIQQASQGSITAIIQVLNDSLADQGVRTRAILSEGMLQLLCEANTPQQLEQTNLVTKVKETLEAIAPNNFRRVKINSRIAREHQILWLDEIKQDPDHQLLWCQEIKLKRPSIFQCFQRLKQSAPNNPNPSFKQQDLKKKPKTYYRSNQKQNQLIIGSIVGILAIFGGWITLETLTSNAKPQTKQAIFTVSERSQFKTIPKPPTTISETDHFSEAVRIAIEASAEGIKAENPAQWLDLAAKWQQASDLMATVPQDHPRYQEAQAKIKEYRYNSEIVIKKAQESQIKPSN